MKAGISLEPIDFQSMQDQVYEQLRTVLMRGGFEPGQKISGRMVSKALGTSEMPARAALGRLLAERALVQNSNGTYAIPVPTRRRLEEIMELRALLEGRATEDACDRIDEAGLEEIRQSNAGLNRAQSENNLDAYLDYNQKLKFAIYRYCSSDTLRAHIELLWLQCGPLLRHLAVDPTKAHATSYCDEAVRALFAREAVAAGEAISNDIRSGLDFLLVHGKFSSESGEEG
ncbi:GntR family transcriptional regulator [Mesorhizobium sp. M3A.F.Ca.ET.080.04.2.1]|uniref:GntR family transcriptional regulator n=1 Tax=Mesorhizobium sp. M3A.F.Ca.ET.080.04.2.1 TaxID=2493676 RepID=UPI000F74F417|nr:GntR family transcriptional regulator [Mesorhizobium sp. M3A.F.Ca.ET.080.04.2.1]AZO07715.1 GntR family transcriptional regulator [Mesorhizobium sp. M3A.F.Ca.ET.080.04.2.1]